MESYKQEFIQFMVDSDVLKFGDFTLKSGRKSPFFMNAGAYVTGSQLKKLGEYYAKAIHDRYGDDFDVLFGPAYKGIPLAVVTAIAYSELYGKEIRYCSDRKEEKDHGADKGSFLGSSLKDGDRVIMIEDVTTSGKSMEETVPKVSVGDGDPPGRNQGPYEKYDGHDGLKTVYRTHRSGNFVLVHLIEVSAFLFVELVIHHSDSGRDEQHAHDQIEHIHAVGARHPPIDIGPEPPQRADQKNHG